MESSLVDEVAREISTSIELSHSGIRKDSKDWDGLVFSGIGLKERLSLDREPLSGSSLRRVLAVNPMSSMHTDWKEASVVGAKGASSSANFARLTSPALRVQPRRQGYLAETDPVDSKEKSGSSTTDKLSFELVFAQILDLSTLLKEGAD